jgi:hypothetical protein
MMTAEDLEEARAFIGWKNEQEREQIKNSGK